MENDHYLELFNLIVYLVLINGKQRFNFVRLIHKVKEKCAG